MLTEIRQCVQDAIALTGAPAPDFCETDAPVLAESILQGEPAEKSAYYIIGLIGGKNVGKSSLVNALVGQEISERSAHGVGTHEVIAYVHRSRVPAVRAMLEHEAHGRYRIVTHELDAMSRQVLLDLPDIDSHFTDHVELTQRMLRHMLYPIWIQSVEKYADYRPKELLLRVTAGNDPANFIFCISKCDQVLQREGPDAVEELRAECAERLARVLEIDLPKVWMISTTEPEASDLATLRQALRQQRSVGSVERAQELAVRQTALSMLGWLERQRLDQTLAALDRLAIDADQELRERVGQPVETRLSQGVLADPALRAMMAEEAVSHRVKHWPIVGVVNLLLDPLASMIRQRILLPARRDEASLRVLVESHLNDGGSSVAGRVQTTFARLQQVHPSVSELYADRHLWERARADEAAAALSQRLARTLNEQMAALRMRFAGRGGAIGRAVRWLPTYGAAVWFPFLQPFLEAYLRPGSAGSALMFIEVLGVSSLMTHGAFLGAYFVALWLILRWDTVRRVNRTLDRWHRSEVIEPELSLTVQMTTWLDELLTPLHTQREHLARVIRQVDDLRRQFQNN